jgi:predicted RNA-binding protein (virulence factor B family)
VAEAKLKGTATNLPAGYTLPAMPDETLNSSTIAGVDANVNGVRDDIEIFIYTNYSKPEEQKVQMQMAKNNQYSLLNVKTKEEVHNWFNDMGNAQDCQIKIFGSNSNALKEDNILTSKILNTVERVKADLNISLLMSGEVFPLIHNDNPCEKFYY